MPPGCTSCVRFAPVMLVRKALRSRRVRAVLAVAGIATSTLLVLVLFAAYRSPQQSIALYSAQPGIDLWVAHYLLALVLMDGGGLSLKRFKRLNARQQWVQEANLVDRENMGLRNSHDRANTWSRNCHGRNDQWRGRRRVVARRHAYVSDQDKEMTAGPARARGKRP